MVYAGGTRTCIDPNVSHWLYHCVTDTVLQTPSTYSNKSKQQTKKKKKENETSYGLIHHTANTYSIKHQKTTQLDRHMLPTHKQTTYEIKQKHSKNKLQMHAKYETNHIKPQQNNIDQRKQHRK